MDSDEAQTAVSKQVSDTSVKTFDILLETVRLQHSVDPYSAGKDEEWASTLKELRRLKYPPVQGWNRSLKNMLVKEFLIILMNSFYIGRKSLILKPIKL
jgi:hypothetical protein